MERTFTESNVEIKSTITKTEYETKTSYCVQTKAIKFGYTMVNYAASESEAEKIVNSHVQHLVNMFDPDKHEHIDRSKKEVEETTEVEEDESEIETEE